MSYLRRVGAGNPLGEEVLSFRRLLEGYGLRTVCDAARCPNRSRCYPRRAAAFMVLGGVCTRGCTFCDVPTGRPHPPDPEEPSRLARAARELGLTGVVVTSPTRDDLPDGGASHFAAVIGELRRAGGVPTVEVLVPDFAGDRRALDTVLAAAPDVLNHNLETVPRLYRRVRPRADYRRSLELLERAQGAGTVTKSAFMLGLGEEPEEVRRLLADLLSTGCRRVVIGQYIAPSGSACPVERFVEKEEFAALGEEALAMGFQEAFSAPLARSSFQLAHG